MILKGKDTINDTVDLEVLFTVGKEYCFNPVDNKYTRYNGFVGWIIDDETFKRWLSKEFKEKYFEEVE